MVAAAGAGFSAAEASGLALAALARPATWVLAVAAGLAAWLSSLVAMRGSVRSGIVGQALGAAVLLGAACLAAAVENDGIWGAPEAAPCAVAVISFCFMCILTVLRGPLYQGQESEDLDELPQ